MPESIAPGRRRLAGFAAVTAGLALLVFLVLAELLARQFDPTLLRRKGERNPFWTTHPSRGHALKPNFSGGSIWGVEFRVNSLGFRGPEVSRAKPAGTFRVLVLGDSIIMGSGLSEPDTLPAILQAELTQRWPEKRFEVLNAGVSGYGLREEYLVLKEDGLSLSPDLVVLGFCLNDVPGTVFADHINPRRDVRLPGKNRLLALSALARFIQERYNRIGLRNDFLGLAEWLAAPAGSAVDRRVQAGWQAWQAELKPILELCRAHQLPFLLVAFPHRGQFEDRWREFRPQHELTRLSREMNFDLLDPAPDFARGLDQVYVFGDPVHPSGFGHRLIARRIADWMEKKVFTASISR